MSYRSARSERLHDKIVALMRRFSFGIRRKRQMSDEQRAAAAERLAAYRDSDDDDTDE